MRRPAWKAVAARLEAEIAAGSHNTASRLPPETSLARTFDVSRHTIRRAIAALQAKGFVRTVPRNGALLVPPKLSLPLSGNDGFTDAIREVGLLPGARLLGKKRCIPPVDVARKLRIASRSEVIELEIVRTAGDKPLACVTVWFPAERFPRIAELFEGTGGLRQAMALHGVTGHRRTNVRMSARHAIARERDVLGLDEAAIVLVAEAVSHDAADESTHVALLRFPAERVDVVFEQ